MATETRATTAALNAAAAARFRRNKRLSALPGRLKAPGPVIPQGSRTTATSDTKDPLEHPSAEVLIHMPWAGWYYQTDAD